MSKPYRLPQVEEQIVLDELESGWRPEDHPRLQSLLRRHHYLQGIKRWERLYYVAVWRGQWLALLVFCAAARHLRHRRSGLADRSATACAFGLVTTCPFPGFAALSLSQLGDARHALCLARLPEDWRRVTAIRVAAESLLTRSCSGHGL